LQARALRRQSGVERVKQNRAIKSGFDWSGRLTGHGWRFDVYIDFLCLAATSSKLAAEEKQRGDSDNYKDHQYGHDCSAAAVTAYTMTMSHKFNPPLCTEYSLFVGDVSARKSQT
jgi:hypothetical protein